MSAKHLEPGRDRRHYVRCITVVLLAAIMVAGVVLAGDYMQSRRDARIDAMCAQGASTPVKAVESALGYAAEGDWRAACKTVDGDEEEVEGVLGDVVSAGVPAEASVGSTEPGWKRVDVEVQLRDRSSASSMSLWTKAVVSADGSERWLVSLDGE